MVPGAIKWRYCASPNSNERNVPSTAPSMAEHGTSLEMKRTSLAISLAECLDPESLDQGSRTTLKNNKNFSENVFSSFGNNLSPN